MNQPPAPYHTILFALAFLTSQVWSWFAAPHMDQAPEASQVTEDQSRDAALLFKLVNPTPTDDRPLWTQQLPEASKDSPRLLGWALKWCTAYYGYDHIPVPPSLGTWENTAVVAKVRLFYGAADPTRGPPQQA